MQVYMGDEKTLARDIANGIINTLGENISVISIAQSVMPYTGIRETPGSAFLSIQVILEIVKLKNKELQGKKI